MFLSDLNEWHERNWWALKHSAAYRLYVWEMLMGDWGGWSMTSGISIKYGCHNMPLIWLMFYFEITSLRVRWLFLFFSPHFCDCLPCLDVFHLFPITPASLVYLSHSVPLTLCQLIWPLVLPVPSGSPFWPRFLVLLLVTFTWVIGLCIPCCPESSQEPTIPTKSSTWRQRGGKTPF